MFVSVRLTTGLCGAVLAALILTSSGTTVPTEIDAIEYSEGYSIETTQSGDGLFIIDSHGRCELICNQ